MRPLKLTRQFQKFLHKVVSVWRLVLVLALNKDSIKRLRLHKIIEIYADSVSFLTSTNDRIQKYSSMFRFPWTNPSVNTLWYIEKWVPWYGLGSMITISAVTSSTLQGLFWVLSPSVSRACLVTCKSAKKCYLMRMRISWLFPFNEPFDLHDFFLVG